MNALVYSQVVDFSRRKLIGFLSILSWRQKAADNGCFFPEIDIGCFGLRFLPTFSSYVLSAFPSIQLKKMRLESRAFSVEMASAIRF